jgi:transcription-repair coupling factor (superfamily II helicase)
MRDLEIRGAGELLGTHQHGHIAAVGFHLYTRLLAEAVRRLRKENGAARTPLPASLDVESLAQANVDLPIPVNIPADYVPDKGMRLRLYRRLADIHAVNEVEALDEEFQDRFGAPPEPVRNLLYQIRLRLLAEKAGLTSINVENGQIALRYPEGAVPSSLPDLGPFVRVGKTALWISISQAQDWQDYVIQVLGKLVAIPIPSAGNSAHVP